jgi:hypothetical protein
LIAPTSRILTTGAQSYSIGDGAVNFGLAGPTGGIIDNANSGQTISISNNIGESATDVQVQLLNSSTPILSGTNSYAGERPLAISAAGDQQQRCGHQNGRAIDLNVPCRWIEQLEIQK